MTRRTMEPVSKTSHTWWTVKCKLSLLLIVLCTESMFAQQSRERDVAYPLPLPAGAVCGSAGISVTFIPRPIAEEEIRQIPMPEARVRVGLGSGFAVTGRLGTNVLTNVITTGAQWSAHIPHGVAGVGIDETIVRGFASMDGFDVDYHGWITAPYVMVGWSVGDVNFSVRAETVIITDRTTRVGDVVSINEKNLRAGNAIALFVEQPLSDATRILLGLKVHNLKSAYQSWLAFSTFNDPLIYPEFIVGAEL